MKLVLLAAAIAIAVGISERPIVVTIPAPVVVTVEPTDHDYTIRVTKDEITYRGRLVMTTVAATCPDSPCFVVDSLVDALRADVTRPRTIPISIEANMPSFSDTGNITLRLLSSILRAGNDALVTSL
jgi:hypothetical protein